MNIIVIEEDPDWKVILNRMLPHFGARVVVIDSHDIVKVLKKNEVDVVLLDILVRFDSEQIIVLESISILEQIKADPSTCGIPVIIISADYNEIGKSELFGLGAEAYLRKEKLTIELPAILERIRKH